jgi:hypothetical protein
MCSASALQAASVHCAASCKLQGCFAVWTNALLHAACRMLHAHACSWPCEHGAKLCPELTWVGNFKFAGKLGELY